MTVVQVIRRAAQFRNDVNSFLKKVSNCFPVLGGNEKRKSKKRAKTRAL